MEVENTSKDEETVEPIDTNENSVRNCFILINMLF